MNPVARKRLVLAAVGVAFGCSILSGYLWSARIARPTDGGTASPPADVEQEGAGPSYITVRYKGCGHILVRPSSAGRDMFIEAEGLCPDDAPYRLVTLKDGYVAVYYGRAAFNDALKEIRQDLPAARLPRGDVEKLLSGEIVLGDDGVARLLEGLLD